MKKPETGKSTVDHKKIALKAPNDMVMYLVNPNRRHFEIWSEPGGSDKGGNERKRCDYICTKLNKPEFEYYVELKKTFETGAATQLMESIKTHSKVSSGDHRKAFIIYSNMKFASQLNKAQKIIDNFSKQTNKTELLIKRVRYEEFVP